MSIAEISKAWIDYRNEFRMLTRFPKSTTYQRRTAKAYAHLVMVQAQYAVEIKPV